MPARLLPPLLISLAFVALGPLALADPYPQYGDCDSAGWPALERIEITGGSAGTTFYVDDENYLLGNGIWVYQEANGVWAPKLPGVYLEGHNNANLQRGGGSPIFAGAASEPDICTDDPNGAAGPDQFLF